MSEPKSAWAEWAKFTARPIPALVRDVALKLLPEKFACDTERMARFEREAKVYSKGRPFVMR